MSRATAPRTPRIPSAAFAVVEEVGLTLPGVAVATKYDGSPLLKLGGCFMAGLATHATAEPNTLVVRISPDDRALLIADAPDTYYVTDDHLKHPVVLVRLSRIDRDALRDILTVSWRLTAAKSRRATSSPRGSNSG